jgi:hypothetical protein
MLAMRCQDVTLPSTYDTGMVIVCQEKRLGKRIATLLEFAKFVERKDGSAGVQG